MVHTGLRYAGQTDYLEQFLEAHFSGDETQCAPALAAPPVQDDFHNPDDVKAMFPEFYDKAEADNVSHQS